MDAQVGRDTTACAPTVTLATRTETTMQPTVLKDGYSPGAQHGATPQVFTSDGGRSSQETAPFLQSSDRIGKLGRRIWDLGGRPMH